MNCLCSLASQQGKLWLSLTLSQLTQPDPNRTMGSFQKPLMEMPWFLIVPVLIAKKHQTNLSSCRDATAGLCWKALTEIEVLGASCLDQEGLAQWWCPYLRPSSSTCTRCLLLWSEGKICWIKLLSFLEVFQYWVYYVFLGIKSLGILLLDQAYIFLWKNCFIGPNICMSNTLPVCLFNLILSAWAKIFCPSR